MRIPITSIFRFALIGNLLLLVTACGSNPQQTNESNDSSANSLDNILYSRARTSFFEEDYKTAATLLDPLATKGNTEAQYSLGYLYYHGKGVKRDVNQAIKWFEKSAKQNHPHATEALRLMQAAVDKKKTAASNKRFSQNSKPVLDLRSLNTTKAEQKTKPAQPIPDRHDLPEKITQREQTIKHLPQPMSDSGTGLSGAQRDPAAFSPPTEAESLSWINNQSTENFTIQLASNTREAPVIHYIEQVALDGVYYFSSKHNGVTRFTVIHGSFSSFTQAKNKLARLQERGFKKAWIRMMKKIQFQANTR